MATEKHRDVTRTDGTTGYPGDIGYTGPGSKDEGDAKGGDIKQRASPSKDADEWREAGAGQEYQLGSKGYRPGAG